MQIAVCDAWKTGAPLRVKSCISFWGINPGRRNMGKRGPAPGTGGRPRKPLAEKIATGNPGRRKLTVVELPEPENLTGVDMPEVKEFMREQQRDGGELCAEEVYTETWQWLKSCGCERLVSVQLIQQYAMCVARWILTEQAISKYGSLSKHPTTGAPIASPYVAMEQNYMKQANQLWASMYSVVRENCSTEFGATPQDDVMDRLLRSREG